ncbi:hypothetical protein GGR53DRAFT_233048 [Hypoxylon sp. FL1150]|nr:hypothetical protein GGR53DRAFT_233048 [Hypoxylon sp. FL1150]
MIYRNFLFPAERIGALVVSGEGFQCLLPFLSSLVLARASSLPSMRSFYYYLPTNAYRSFMGSTLHTVRTMTPAYNATVIYRENATPYT